jgi:hypothetical protein
MKTLSDVEAAYVAGIIDGEGTITSRQALRLLAQVYPFPRTYKSQRARLLLDEYQGVTPRNGRYTLEQREAREQLVVRFFAISTRARTPNRVAREPRTFLAS